MGVHIGKNIKQELILQKIPVTIFAGLIHRSRNVAYDIFERETIDTGLLTEISKVLKVDFFSLYSSMKEFKDFKTLKNGELPRNRNKVESIEILQNQIGSLQKEMLNLKKIIDPLVSPKAKTKKGK